MKIEKKLTALITTFLTLFFMSIFYVVAHAENNELCIITSSVHIELENENAYIVASGCNSETHKWRISRRDEQTL